MVVRVKTRSDVPTHKAGDVSEASANGNNRSERVPFSRDYLDYWVPLLEAVT